MSSVKYAAVVFVALILSTSAPHKCERLTRANIEAVLGQATQCAKERKNVECFGGRLEPYTVQFNDAGFVEQIIISNSCAAIVSLKKDLDRIVPEHLRGSFQTRTKATYKSSCDWGNEEQYECLDIEFVESLCMDCSRAKIAITWKASETRTPPAVN